MATAEEIVNSKSAHAAEEFPQMEEYGQTIFDKESDERKRPTAEVTSGGSFVPSKFDEITR